MRRAIRRVDQDVAAWPPPRAALHESCSRWLPASCAAARTPRGFVVTAELVQQVAATPASSDGFEAGSPDQLVDDA